jgi:hypothetical protein
MHSSSPGTFDRSLLRAVLVLVVLVPAVTVLAAATACSEEDPHIAFIGAVDAAPPRVGRPAADAGTR